MFADDLVEQPTLEVRQHGCYLSRPADRGAVTLLTHVEQPHAKVLPRAPVSVSLALSLSLHTCCCRTLPCW
jgi:hypothetical protein